MASQQSQLLRLRSALRLQLGQHSGMVTVMVAACLLWPSAINRPVLRSVSFSPLITRLTESFLERLSAKPVLSCCAMCELPPRCETQALCTAVFFWSKKLLPCSLQTESYLEELTDTVPEADMQTQTDAFLDRPATPMFVPAKMGVDATTQIEAGDLFDFDFEVGYNWDMGHTQLAVGRLPAPQCTAARPAS